MRRRKRGQSYVEFVIAVFIFIGILIFLFSALFVRTQQESVVIDEQTNCAKAEAIANALLKSCGTPSDWEDDISTLKVLGLTNCTNYIVPQLKWDRARDSLFPNRTIVSSPVSNVSWRISYQGYAATKKTDVGGPQCGNALVENKIGTTICRSGGNTMDIIVNSTSAGRMDMYLFLPNITIVLLDPDTTIEGDDESGVVFGPNGTIVELHLRTDKTDMDKARIFTSGMGGMPTLTYIESHSFTSATNPNLPIYLGNTSFYDSMGSEPLRPSNLCKVHRGGLITRNAGGTDAIPVRFIVEAWS